MIHRNLIAFLILSSGCSSAPINTAVDVNWQFVDHEGEKLACLNEEDVDKVRELLIRCEER